MALRKILVTGVSGSLGAFLLEKLLAAGFDVTILRRVGSKATFSAPVPVIDADFSSVASLTAALAGQDAVVSTLSPAFDAQLPLVDAAVAAGVQRIIPSEFGSDLDVPQTRALPVYAHKVAVQDRIIQAAKTSSLTYTFVYNAAFLDWGIDKDFLLPLSDGKRTIFDSGNTEFGATTLSAVADAVVGVLRHPEETKNRSVRVKEVTTTQNKLLELSRQVAPDGAWEVKQVRIDDATAEADRRLQQGLLDFETFLPYVYRTLVDPACGTLLAKNDNELLGIKEKGDDFIVDVLKKVLGSKSG